MLFVKIIYITLTMLHFLLTFVFFYKKWQKTILKVGLFMSKTISLPTLELSTVASINDPKAKAIHIPQQKNNGPITYHIKTIENPYIPSKFNLFPVVLDSNNTPWAEAQIYILCRMDSESQFSTSTIRSIAADLAFYRQFLDKEKIDWTVFPSHKLLRPTYRYNAHLKHLVASGEIAASTARRRISTILGVYRFFISEGILNPENAPWKESDRYIDFRDSHGFEVTKKIITTDISIKIPHSNNPYDEYICDGGKLRPLTAEEQRWVMEALFAAQNFEMTLIHLTGFATGARLQTILTIGVEDIIKHTPNNQSPIIMPVGRGTGIDTKNGKKMNIIFPAWLFKILQTYAKSPRAKKRQNRAQGENYAGQYLFLSQRGTPFYHRKSDLKYNPSNTLRHVKEGQAIRQFIREKIIPYILNKTGNARYHFQFHDTRATAGMNEMDYQLKLVEQGEKNLLEALDAVKTFLCHESLETTERYLNYRRILKQVRLADQRYELHLKELAIKALGEDYE